MESAEKFIDLEFGRSGDTIGKHFEQQLTHIMEKHLGRMREDIETFKKKFEQETDVQSNIFLGLGRQAQSWIKYIPPTKMVDFARKGIFIGRDLLKRIGIIIKFKPWQVVKFAKAVPILTVLLELLMLVVDALVQSKRDARLKELKETLLQGVEETFQEIQSTLQGDALFENYVPDFLSVQSDLEAAQKELQDLKENMRLLAVWTEAAKELQLGLENLR